MDFRFFFGNKQQRGIVILAVIILVLQLFIVFGDKWQNNKPLLEDNKEWLVHQKTLDSLNKTDGSLAYLKPFNPNFITDYKGSSLGMTTVEIDRLFAFRKENKYVNSAKEFQQVTKISDSLLAIISPYFKFPDWVTNKNSYKPFKPFDKNYVPKAERTYAPKIIVKQDFNLATGDDLVKIYGIGDATATRILEFKAKLGAFVSMDQLHDIWGLSPEVIEELNKHFQIQTIEGLKKININTMSVSELIKFPYFNHGFAKQIVVHRSMHGNIKIEDLTKIKGCPMDKIKIIELYLTF